MKAVDTFPDLFTVDNLHFRVFVYLQMGLRIYRFVGVCVYKPLFTDKHDAVAVLMNYLWVSGPKVSELCLIITATSQTISYYALTC